MEPREESRQTNPSAAASPETSLHPFEDAFLAVQPRPGHELTAIELSTLSNLYTLLDLHHRPLEPREAHLKGAQLSVDWNIAISNAFHVARYLFETGKHEDIYESICWFLLRNKRLPGIYRPFIFLMMSQTRTPARPWLRMAFETCKEWAVEISSGRRKDRGYQLLTKVLTRRFRELPAEKTYGTLEERWQVRVERLYALYLFKAKAAEKGQLPAQTPSPSYLASRSEHTTPHLHFVSSTESIVCTGELKPRWHPAGSFRVILDCYDYSAWTSKVPRLDICCHEITQYVCPLQDLKDTGTDVPVEGAAALHDHVVKQRKQTQVSAESTFSNTNSEMPPEQSSPSSFVTNPWASPPQNQISSTNAVSNESSACAQHQSAPVPVSISRSGSGFHDDTGFTPPNHESGFTTLFKEARAKELGLKSPSPSPTPSPTPGDMAHLADPASMEM